MSESYSNETNIVDAGEAASLRPKKRRSQTGVKMQDLGFDAITHYSRKLEVLSQCYAFVTFKSQKIAQIASQILLVAPLSTLSVRPAPVPNDILWNSALSSPARHTLLNVVNKIVALVICLFWTIPTSIIASAASSSTLTEIGHLDPIFTDPTFSFILENVIPPLITNFFNAFVPTIFEWLAFRSSLECHTWIEMRIMHQYLLFLWLNTFFVFSSTSTIFLIFDNFFDSPKFILQTIAETMAKGSTFFIYLYESYGRHWIPSFTHCIIGLFLSQLVIIGYLFAKTAPYEALACCPLLLGTHYYYRHTINTFRPHTQYVPQDQLSLEEIIEQISGSIRDTDRVVDTLENHYQTLFDLEVLSLLLTAAFSKASQDPRSSKLTLANVISKEVENSQRTSKVLHSLEYGVWYCS
ncbi:hypothetical protein BJ742DRAFT_865340 [Cladochytrium replicatum]|nr:hypothetical protein BJ742DRAFT_865340 [Cladochytrium replicatum]